MTTITVKSILGFDVCIDDETGLVLSFYSGKHLFKWNRSLRCYTNVMPCSVSSFRYFVRLDSTVIE